MSIAAHKFGGPKSLKMEIPVLAESAGTVDEVKVHEGDVVQEGDLLVVIA